MSDDIDSLLALPLDDVADDGFSARVQSQILARETRRERWLSLLPVAGVCALVPFLPLREAGAFLAHLGPSMAGSTAMSLAAAALILTYVADSRLRE